MKKWSEHLLLEGKSAILVGVEELNESVGLALADREVSVVSQVVEDLKGRDEGVAVTIESLESGVWGEVSDGAETLAGIFECSLAVTDSHKKLLKSSL